MEWNDAISDARESLGYGPNEYISDWDEVVQEARSLISYEKKEQYHIYLQSDRWKRTRAEVLKRDNNECVDCKARAQEVHHESYDNVCADDDEFDYVDEDEVRDCVSLCSVCHRGRHS